MKKIISCDVGTKFHGFALSDSSRKFVIKSWTKKILNSSSGLICNEASDNDVDLIAIGLPVRMSGGDSDMSIHIKSIAKNNNLMLIEDSAQALGAEYKDKKLGTFGDIASFSFDAGKSC